MLFTHNVLPLYRERKEGVIINIVRGLLRNDGSIDFRLLDPEQRHILSVLVIMLPRRL